MKSPSSTVRQPRSRSWNIEEGIFKDQVLEIEGNIKIAEAELTFAQDQLVAAKARREGDPLEIKRAELAGLRARFALEKAQSRKKALVDFTRGKRIKELKATVQKYRSDELAKKAIWELTLSKAKKLERAISACRILAPIDGTVVQLVAEGATVHERQDAVSDRSCTRGEPWSPVIPSRICFSRASNRQ